MVGRKFNTSSRRFLTPCPTGDFNYFPFTILPENGGTEYKFLTHFTLTDIFYDFYNRKWI